MQLDLIPHIQQFDGAWSIYPPSAESFKAALASTDWKTHFAEWGSRVDAGEHHYSGSGFEITDGLCGVVDLEGVMSKYGSSMSRSGSTVRFRQVLRNIRSAYDDGRVQSCMIVIESGGGTTMGTPEAAAEVKATADHLPTWAYIEDIGASAAYWVASQAGRVVCNESALVGSIGTYMSVSDFSEMFKKKGIKTNLVAARTFKGNPSKFKGAGAIGTEVTDEQLDDMQSVADDINSPFLAAIQSARGLDDNQMETVSNGKVWRGQKAVKAGLVDAVMTYEAALAELAGVDTNPSNKKETTMSAKPKASNAKPTKSNKIKAKSEEMDDEEDTSAEDNELEDVESADDEEEAETKPASKAKPKSNAPAGTAAASIADLEAALPKADSKFILGALKAGMSVDQARMTWMEQTIESQEKQIETLQSKSDKPGVKALGTGNKPKSFDGDAKSSWKSAIKEKMDGGMSRGQAVSSVTREQPDLHSAYVEACNTR